jgi:nucleotide-binding universal stress UspA family protein
VIGLIVVGVDGSRHAQAALVSAAEEARRRGARLRVVTAWHVSALAYAGGFGSAAALDPRVFEEAARETLAQAVGALGPAAEGLEIETRLREGHPADVLVEEAIGADLLVVGSRGHGGFAELLLGSVSHQCAQHARCPLLIVRDRAGG